SPPRGRLQRLAYSYLKTPVREPRLCNRSPTANVSGGQERSRPGRTAKKRSREDMPPGSRCCARCRLRHRDEVGRRALAGGVQVERVARLDRVQEVRGGPIELFGHAQQAASVQRHGGVDAAAERSS